MISIVYLTRYTNTPFLTPFVYIIAMSVASAMAPLQSSILTLTDIHVITGYLCTHQHGWVVYITEDITETYHRHLAIGYNAVVVTQTTPRLLKY